MWPVIRQIRLMNHAQLLGLTQRDYQIGQLLIAASTAEMPIEGVDRYLSEWIEVHIVDRGGQAIFSSPCWRRPAIVKLLEPR